MILPALLVGAALGAGVLLVVRGALAPPPVLLGRRLADLYEPPPTDSLAVLRARWRRWALQAATVTGSDLRALHRDLAVSRVSLERHAAVKLGFAVGGAVLPIAAAMIWRVAGLIVPVGAVALVAAATAVIGFLTPDVLIARQAAAARRDFRYAISQFVELMAVVLAGGGGVETALHDAAKSGTGWAFEQLRVTLDGAREQKESLWGALRRLGERIGSVELIELASTAQLAGTSGAPVGDSLRAKATSIRDRELAEAEAEALAASERMGAPMVGMFLGFILLVGYPAMATILAI